MAANIYLNSVFTHEQDRQIKRHTHPHPHTHTLVSLLLRLCLSSPLRCLELELLLVASLLLVLMGSELDD